MSYLVANLFRYLGYAWKIRVKFDQDKQQMVSRCLGELMTTHLVTKGKYPIYKIETDGQVHISCYFNEDLCSGII